MKTVDGDGNYTHDASGNELTAMVYDSGGRLISSTTNTYDQASNLIKSVDGDGNSTVYTYDADGNVVTQQTFDAGGTLADSTANTYDEAANLIETVNRGGDVTRTTYDADGNMLSQTLGYGGCGHAVQLR